MTQIVKVEVNEVDKPMYTGSPEYFAALFAGGIVGVVVHSLVASNILLCLVCFITGLPIHMATNKLFDVRMDKRLKKAEDDKYLREGEKEVELLLKGRD